MKKNFFKRDYAEDVMSEELAERIRTKLKLDKKELPTKNIRRTVNLSNEFIGDWIANNADGYIPLKNCGHMAVSKNLPHFYRDYKFDTIENIMSNPGISKYNRETLLRKYNTLKKPSLTQIKNFFYTHRVMWFNARNCDFEKAEIYTFNAVKKIGQKIGQRIRKNKEYFEWEFRDFRKIGEESLSRKRNKRNSPERKMTDKKLRAIKNHKRGIK